MQGKREMHGGMAEMEGWPCKALSRCEIEVDGEGLGMWVRLTGEF